MPTPSSPFYQLKVNDVLTQLDTSSNGLSHDEAATRLHRDGPNQLEHAHHQLAIVVFLRQFKELLVLILIISAGIALYLQDYRTAVILFIIAFVNASVGYFQEHKAESLMNSLEKLVVPKAKVVRASELTEEVSSELVIGDVVYIEEGDSVPADLRLIDEEELASNDFALTGESNPSRKFVHPIASEVLLANRHNLLYMGTTIAVGHGHGVVIGTGMNTELGRITSLSTGTVSGLSPLQREMNNLATRLTQGASVLAVLLFVVSLQSNLGWHDALLFAIAISAAMVPNGLAAEVNIALAQTAGRMALNRALVKKLSAVETLGATTIICTDKTGTLTKNEMTVERATIGNRLYLITGTGYQSVGKICDDKNIPVTTKVQTMTEIFFRTALLASNARVDPPDDEHATWYVVGDPTEGALITLAKKAGLDPVNTDKTYPEVRELQFDSARKRMSSVRQTGKTFTLYSKGAPESILERCTRIWENGKIRPITADDKTRLSGEDTTYAKQARRNLALAYRPLPTSLSPLTMTFDEAEKDLILLGMVSMVDPLRDEVSDAMEAAHNAHIKVSIITGDSPVTAEAIARQAHLVGPDQKITIILGQDFAAMSDADIVRAVYHGGAVFSRVAPEDKLRIIDLVRRKGYVVAVTGDGINDAPALKRADIGVAMGLIGTDVAKQASEIVLLDDSFSTLVKAIEQGRLTFHNIKKAAHCALTDNAGELMAVLFGLAGQALWGFPAAITAVQILAIDVVAELFPITALGWDPAQRELMHDKPRNLRDHIINRKSVIEFISFGILSAGLAYANFAFFAYRSGLSLTNLADHHALYASATILTYLTIVLCQFVNLFLVRTDDHEPFFTSYIWSNPRLLIAFGLSFLAILAIIYVPAIQPYFGSGPLSGLDWITAGVCALAYLIFRLGWRRFTVKHRQS
jgi:Ca2+-transporting ATPase